jgi:hypothetical protein
LTRGKTGSLPSVGESKLFVKSSSGQSI